MVHKQHTQQKLSWLGNIRPVLYNRSISVYHLDTHLILYIFHYNKKINVLQTKTRIKFLDRFFNFIKTKVNLIKKVIKTQRN